MMIAANYRPADVWRLLVLRNICRILSHRPDQAYVCGYPSVFCSRCKGYLGIGRPSQFAGYRTLPMDESRKVLYE